MMKCNIHPIGVLLTMSLVVNESALFIRSMGMLLRMVMAVDVNAIFIQWMIS